MILLAVRCGGCHQECQWLPGVLLPGSCSVPSAGVFTNLIIFHGASLATGLFKIRLMNFYLSSFTVWWGGFVVERGTRIWGVTLQWIFVHLQLRAGTAGTIPMVLYKMFGNCWSQQVFLSVVTKMSFSSWLINVNGEKCFTVAVFCLP